LELSLDYQATNSLPETQACKNEILLVYPEKS
jgi:hypothetical protein